jgi:hypothetical protein
VKHVLEYHINPNRLHKGSVNGRDYESFPVTILVWNDETNTVYDEESEYQKFMDY